MQIDAVEPDIDRRRSGLGRLDLLRPVQLGLKLLISGAQGEVFFQQLAYEEDRIVNRILATALGASDGGG